MLGITGLTCFLLFTFATVLWMFLKHLYTYWERKGFPYLKPNIPFGNLKTVVFGRKSFGLVIYDLYQSSKEPFVGIYLLFRPGLLIRDAELSKSVLMENFASFHDRGVYEDESDPITQNLFSLPGLKWKSLRSKLTPAFSSGKLKNMFETIENVGKTMTDYLNFIVTTDKEETVDVGDLCGRYAVDIIANVIFGLEVNSFAEPKNQFRLVTEKINEPGIFNAIRILATFLCPGLFKFVPVAPTDPYIKDFMIDVVKKTIAQRENTNYIRKDFMQLLIQLRNTGKLNLDDSFWDVETVAENLKSMPVEICAAQAFLFYIAGSETTSLTISYCLYEFTRNKDIMEKAVEEVDRILEKYDGKITYDSIQEMKYLELCVMETLRKYPGLPLLNRECTQDYKIPNTDYVIEKGTPIIISLLGLQRDPEYFPDPMKFDPERFSKDSKNYKEAAYLPFGEGPRACIGIRLGKINVKVALTMLLAKYQFKATTLDELGFYNNSVSMKPKESIKLLTSRRRHSKLR